MNSKQLKRTLFALLTLTCVLEIVPVIHLAAQGTGQRLPGKPLEWGPTVLPSGTQTISPGVDLRANEITLSIGLGCSDTVVSVFDNALTPLPLVNSLVLSNTAATGPVAFMFESGSGRLFPGGVRLSASQAGCITGFVNGK